MALAIEKKPSENEVATVVLAILAVAGIATTSPLVIAVGVGAKVFGLAKPFGQSDPLKLTISTAIRAAERDHNGVAKPPPVYDRSFGTFVQKAVPKVEPWPYRECSDWLASCLTSRRSVGSVLERYVSLVGRYPGLTVVEAGARTTDLALPFEPTTDDDVHASLAAAVLLEGLRDDKVLKPLGQGADPTTYLEQAGAWARAVADAIVDAITLSDELRPLSSRLYERLHFAHEADVRESMELQEALLLRIATASERSARTLTVLRYGIAFTVLVLGLLAGLDVVGWIDPFD
jgi:hypothetical protein